MAWLPGLLKSLGMDSISWVKKPSLTVVLQLLSLLSYVTIGQLFLLCGLVLPAIKWK